MSQSYGEGRPTMPKYVWITLSIVIQFSILCGHSHPPEILMQYMNSPNHKIINQGVLFDSYVLFCRRKLSNSGSSKRSKLKMTKGCWNVLPQNAEDVNNPRPSFSSSFYDVFCLVCVFSHHQFHHFSLARGGSSVNLFFVWNVIMKHCVSAVWGIT